MPSSEPHLSESTTCNVPFTLSLSLTHTACCVCCCCWQVIKLSEFFDAFKPLNGGLSGVELARMHACLKDQDITSKPFDVFCTDVDVDDEHRVTLYSLNRYVCIHRSPHHSHLTPSSDLAFLLLLRADGSSGR